MIKVSESQKRLEELFEALKGVDNLLILTHNNPDPDAIASAVALKFLLANKLGFESHISYGGIIGRAENKALIRCLGHPLRHLTNLSLDETIPIAFVDTQPGAGNNALPAGAAVAIVIDHHPWQEATSMAGFVDVRHKVGATSTILTEYLQAAGLEPTPLLATALFYGIKTDTRGLGRSNVCPADVAAYLYLQPRLEVEVFAEIEYAQVPVDYFRSFDTALRAVRTYNGVVIAHIGQTKYPDIAAETADFLLPLEGSRWVICTGVYEGVLILSVRTPRWQGEAGQLAQAIVGRDGVAGGHGVMAGGQVPLRGRDPAQVVQQLGQRALQYLKVTPEVAGRPLI
jgi:nanoRNase/pAp phosphatase (c-di-AMP/oligoRNAs hydrolase)